MNPKNHRYTIREEQYRFLDKLQSWTAEKMKAFDDAFYIRECKTNIEIIHQVKQKGYYTDEDKTWLNQIRENYITDKLRRTFRRKRK